MLLRASCLALSACALSRSALVLPATGARWAGRTLPDMPAAGAVTFAWEGTRADVAVVTSGAASSVSMLAASSYASAGASRFRVYVDGAPLPGLVDLRSGGGGGGGGASNVTLASGLGAGAHTVTLWSVTDPITLSWPLIENASLAVFAFAVSSGAFARSPPPLARTLLFIGDSISAGNQINSSTCEDDHSGTFGAQLCASFDAQCQTAAISGKGLYANCCDDNATMAVLATRTLPGDAASHWDDARFLPDAVVLALGTNDQNHAQGNATWIAGFISTFADYLVNLTVAHGNNAQLPIFCGVGPITHDYAPWVLQAMAAAAARGVRNTHFVNWTTPVDRCGHPDYDGHTMMYETARPIIAAVLGWA